MNEEEKKEQSTTNEQQAGNTSADTNNETKTFTQEELNKIISERLAREKKQRQELEAKLKQYEEEINKNLPEAERYKKQYEEAIKQLKQTQKELQSLRTLNLKLEILDKEGLPKAWAKRIQGETEEDIRKDIEELKKLLGIKGNNIANSVFPRASSKQTNINDLINNALRKAVNK